MADTTPTRDATQEFRAFHERSANSLREMLASGEVPEADRAILENIRAMHLETIGQIDSGMIFAERTDG